MSIVKIRSALELALSAMTPAISLAYENAAFVPVAGVPYQKPFLLSATPQNPTMGDGYYREVGYMQVTLMYPIQAGTVDAASRALLIQALFKRGSTFSNGGVTVKIMATPAITAGQRDGDRWALLVKIPYQADIFN